MTAHKPTSAAGSADPRMMREEVEQAREQLADTVAALAEKADMKAQAREIAAHAKSRALFEANEAKARVQHTAEKAAKRGFDKPGPILAVAGGLGAAALVAYYVLNRPRGKRKK